MEKYYQTNFDWNSKGLVSQYDELSVWAAPFGKMLLDNVPLNNISRYIDVACGTGFPLIDLAQRIGESCEAIGIDPWEAAIDRCNEKIKTIGLTNVRTIKGCFEKVAIEHGSIDLITSNLGINNFNNQTEFFNICNEWLKQGGKLALTTNLNGTFLELYECIEEIIRENKVRIDKNAFYIHVNHRGTIESITEMIKKSGLMITRLLEAEFSLRYSNGSSFLRHSVIKSGFLGAWKTFVLADDEEEFFKLLEIKLNERSANNGLIEMTIPMAYIESSKKISAN